MLEIFLSSFIGGLLGAALMDITEIRAAHFGIYSGVNIKLVGRWAVALVQGTWRHPDIRVYPPQPREELIGWLFHFLIAGGGVALLLPGYWLLAGIPADLTSPGPYVLFGLGTSLLPWFILLPSYGWGVFGRRGPDGSNAVLASALSHIPYGLGIWFCVAAGNSL